MVFLDANAFYWYYGRDKLNIPSSQKINEADLRKFLDEQPQKSIASSVYMEVITHFRDDAEKLKNIIAFISDKNIQIYNVSLQYCCSPQEVACVHIMDEKGLLGYANLMKRKKINIEVSFAVAFFEVVRLLYLEYIKKYNTDLTEGEKDLLFDYVGVQMNKLNIKKYTNAFTDALEKGYEENNEAKFLKQAYIDALTEECLFIHLFIELIEKHKDDKADLVEVLQAKYAELSSEGFNLDLIDKEIMKSIVSELEKDTPYLTFAKQEISNILKKKKFSHHQCEYIKDVMLTAWLERGQKIRKNDIFDMICVGVLDFKNFYFENVLVDAENKLLSFDKVMRNYLKDNSLNSFNLSARFMQ